MNYKRKDILLIHIYVCTNLQICMNKNFHCVYIFTIKCLGISIYPISSINFTTKSSLVSLIESHIDIFHLLLL